MAEIITENGRKAIKKIAEISQVARAISLMPTGEEFVLRLIGDLTIIAKRVNSLSSRMNDILDRYASIPTEFLLEGFDEVLDKLNDINDTAKFAISETANLFSSTVSSVNDLTNAIGDATSAVTSATLQIGGGLTYGAVATYSNIELATKGVSTDQVDLIRDEVMKDVIDGKIPVSEMNAEIERRCIESVSSAAKTAEDIRDWTENAAKESTESIDGFFDDIGSGLAAANEWIEGVKDDADSVVDNTVGKAIEMVENAKKKVEDLIEKARAAVEKFNKDFDDCFGFLAIAADVSNHVSDTASEMNTPIFDAVAEMSDEVTKFIENFSIGKVVSGLAGMAVGAGVATLAMDLLPKIDVDRMLKSIIGGIDTYHMDRMTQLYNNKYYDNAPDGVVELADVPDSIWRLSGDDLINYNANGYEKYLEDYAEINDNKRTELYDKLKNSQSRAERRAIRKEIREEYRNWVSNDENKSALKAMRKVRRNAIKAKQIEKYKSFWRTEMDYLKKEFIDIKDNIKKDWDAMMNQYEAAIGEIKKFFSKEGCGGNESIDRCCDRINDDAEQIVELCSSITTELTNAVAMVPTPYAIGTCVDMPVHKILAFFKDVKIILTFLKNLIRLGIDIVSQFTILAKIVANGLQSLAEIMKMLMELIGIDKILNMIDFLVALFRPKMVDAKILLENSLSPIYYDETEEYEARVEAMEAVLENGKGGYVDKFKYTDDDCARDKYKTEYGGYANNDDDVEDWLEELEKKGEREIMAYRSPILNDAGDDFAGWIYYHAYAYDNMREGWSPNKKRRRNRVIKKASKKNKMRGGRLIGGVAQLRRKLGYYVNEEYIKTMSAFDAYYWYTKWTNDPTDCEADFTNLEGKDMVSPIQTTSNGSLVELSDGRRVFVEGKVVQSGDFVNVDGVKYRVK
jgi:hypothetical protein